MGVSCHKRVQLIFTAYLTGLLESSDSERRNEQENGSMLGHSHCSYVAWRPQLWAAHHHRKRILDPHNRRAAIDTFGFEVQTNAAGMQIFGGRAFDLTGATGLVTAFRATTDINGLATISSGRTNAKWNFTAESGRAPGRRFWRRGLPRQSNSSHHQNVSPFAISPSGVDGNSPAAVTLSGSGISTAYGTPQAWIIDADVNMCSRSMLWPLQVMAVG